MNTRSIILWGSVLAILSLSAVAVWFLPQPQQTVIYQSTTTLTVPVGDDEHSRGNPDAKVTVVVYSDLQCPACAALNESMKGIEAEYQEKVRFVFKHFPMPQHKNALLAAVATEAARRQEKFFEMCDVAFQTQHIWANYSQFNAYLFFLTQAKNLELDQERFRDDINDMKLVELVRKDLESGMSLQLQSVPSFFIDGKLVTVVSEVELRARLDEALHEQ